MTRLFLQPQSPHRASTRV